MFLRSITKQQSKGIRFLHSIPKLKNQSYLEENGIRGLFSPEAFKISWNDHQNYLLKKLNNLTVDTDNESRIPFHILLNTATKSDQAHIFNYASQAHNNHIFFNSLTNSDNNQTKPSSKLLSRINKSFGSLEDLKEAFLSTGDSLLGNGWVFLIEGPDKSLGIMACYNSGTPYHISRAQLFDLNGIVSDEIYQSVESINEAVRSNEKNYNVVLLALNLWEHTYVPDYSVSGKSQYLENWWSSIDWDVVSSRLYSRD